MRPGQNKRMRGRNNNNNGGRKGPNPLTRSYESNGPDVKIRGTAQHIGEKYLQLARDAQTSGDPVAAESYLQHAEHYFRLIAAAQQAQYQAQTGYVRPEGEADEGDDDDDIVPDRFALPSERIQQTVQPPPFVPQPNQPYGERQPRDGVGDRPEGQEQRPYRQERYDRDNRNFGDRQGQPNGERQADRGGYNQDRGYNQERGQNPYRNDRQDRGDRNNRNRFNRDNGDYRDMQYRDQPRMPSTPRDPFTEQRPQPPAPQPADAGQELPAFITAPVRVTPAAEPEFEAAPATEPVVTATSDEAPAETLALRPRRRRRARTVPTADEGTSDAPPSDTPPEG